MIITNVRLSDPDGYGLCFSELKTKSHSIQRQSNQGKRTEKRSFNFDLKENVREM